MFIYRTIFFVDKVILAMIISKKNRTDYVSRGGDNLSDWDYRIVTKMMTERGRKREYVILTKPISYVNVLMVCIGVLLIIVVRNSMLIMMIIYIAVDGILDALEGKYDLLVDDRTKE